MNIRRPLCLARGGGVREEQSQFIDSTGAVASPFCAGSGRHVFGFVQLIVQLIVGTFSS